MGWPPRRATLVSLATRVRVLRLLKRIAIVFLSRVCRAAAAGPSRFAACLNCDERCRRDSICSTEISASVKRLGARTDADVWIKRVGAARSGAARCTVDKTYEHSMMVEM